LIAFQMADSGLLRQVENAVLLGQPLLIEGMADGSLPAGWTRCCCARLRSKVSASCVEFITDWNQQQSELYSAVAVASRTI
jgi:hypothetical protein